MKGSLTSDERLVLYRAKMVLRDGMAEQYRYPPYFRQPIKMETPSTSEIKQFYDGHAQEVQQRVGVNIRHRSILRRLVRAGLLAHHHILEIGCGTGTLTGLVRKRVTTGKILAVDISERAIELAKGRFQGDDRLSFLVSDMSDLSVDQQFNFIVLPDVLEHIPEEQHDELFKTLEKHLAVNGAICIHIPDPFSLEWMRRERPEALQIVDQSLAISDIVERFDKYGLLLDRFERYGLWTKEPDYNWIEFRRTPDRIVQTKWPKFRAIINELASRLGFQL